MRRLDRLKDLFREHGKLTRAEAARILGVSTETAARDLKRLLAEKFIQRVSPSACSRSNYFVPVEATPGGPGPGGNPSSAGAHEG
jgi:predicted ArsR family transcriptional regulator